MTTSYPETPRDWGTPVPLDQGAASQAFPTRVLPRELQDYIEAVAESTQTPADAPAMLALAILGSTVARKVRVRAWGDWCEPLNLYTAVVLPPANRKSPVISELRRPLADFERSELHRLKPVIEEARARHGISAARANRAEKEASNPDHADPESAFQAAIHAARARDDIRVPAVPRLTVDDCTPEKLANVLAEQGGRIAAVSAEGGIFELMAGRYSSNGAPNLDIFLKAHNGDDHVVDRIGRPSERIENPALTIALTVQPEVIHALADKPGLKGRGLLGRFLFSVPRSLLGRRKSMTPAVPARMRQWYDNAVLSLLKIPQPAREHELTLDPDAVAALRSFVDQIEPRLGEGGDLEAMQDWGGKLAGAVLRMAGIRHMVEHHANPEPWEVKVSRQAVEAAIAIGRYATEHARVAYRLMGADPAIARARTVLAWIRRGDGEPFSARDCFNATKSTVRRMDDLKVALDLLWSHEYIRPIERGHEPRAGRPPSRRYEVNPLWWRNPGAERAQSAE